MIKDAVNKQVIELKKLWDNKADLTFQLLNLAMIVFSALMIWKGLMFLTKSESPVVVVLSGSMEVRERQEKSEEMRRETKRKQGVN